MIFEIKKLEKGTPNCYKCKWQLKYKADGFTIEKFFDHFEDMIFYLRTIIKK